MPHPTLLSRLIAKKFGLTVLTSLFLLASCIPASLPTATPTQAVTATVTPSPTATLTQTPNPTATFTATITPSPVPPTATPEPLAVFSPRLLAGIQPATYLQDTCTYLADRWSAGNATPGTVVVPIMYHSVRKEGGTVTDNITVTQDYFKETMDHAKALGFETISIDQLVAFLQHNAYIPPRSMVLIIDDRRLGTVQQHFLPVLQANNWHLVMAYITGVINDNEWQQIKDVLSTGYVEIQAHGFLHNGSTYFTENTPDDVIHNEIYGPIQAFMDHLGYRPTAFIWPGGDFTLKTVQDVRQAGYEVGFSSYSRGPVMFNWVPLGAEEREMNDPLLVLPRYWSTAAYVNLDDAVNYANQAIAFAQQNEQSELDYYNTYCTTDPPIQLAATSTQEAPK